MKKIISIGLILYGLFSMFTCYVAFTSGKPEDVPQGVFSAVLGVVTLFIGIILLIPKKDKHDYSYDEYDEDYEEEYEEEYYSEGKKPFPKIIMTILVFVVSVGVAFGVALLDKEHFFIKIGDFVFDYLFVFLAVFAVLGIIFCTKLVKYGSYDTKINSAFLFKTKKNIGIGQFFCNYFGGVYAQGPLIYSEEDCDIKGPRSAYILFTTIFRYVFTLVAFIGTVEVVFLWISSVKTYDDMLNMAVYGKASIGLMLLLFGPSFDIIFYVLSKMFPFFESRSYNVTKYYSDGSTETETRTESNFIAILVLGAIVYVYYVGWFWAPTARNIVRLIETKRFGDYCDQYSNVDIMDYYE